ncbi:hypothetical protein BGZ93_004522, partial [Podila epicladia]
SIRSTERHYCLEKIDRHHYQEQETPIQLWERQFQCPEPTTQGIRDGNYSPYRRQHRCKKLPQNGTSPYDGERRRDQVYKVKSRRL